MSDSINSMKVFIALLIGFTLVTSCATKKNLVNDKAATEQPTNSSENTAKKNDSDANENVNELSDDQTSNNQNQTTADSNKTDNDEKTKVIGKSDTVIGDTAYIDPEQTKASASEREKILNEVSNKEIIMSKETPTIIQKMGNSRYMLDSKQMADMILCPQSMFLRPDFSNPVILNSSSATGNIVFSIELNKNYARYIEVTVRGYKNDFLLIESMRDRDGKYLFHGLAWAHISHFATSTKSFGSLNTTTLYTYPNPESKIEVQIAGASVVKVEACQNDWLFVRHYNGSSGWLSPEDNCPSMISNCN